jgi:dGTPase
VVDESGAAGAVRMSKGTYDALYGLRAYLFETVYESQLQQTDKVKIKFMITSIFNYFMENLAMLPEFYRRIAKYDGTETAVSDFVSGMSDRYALRLFKELFVPGTLG